MIATGSERVKLEVLITVKICTFVEAFCSLQTSELFFLTISLSLYNALIGNFFERKTALK